MIFTYRDLKDGPQVNIKDKWVPARPLNHQHRSFFQRLREAWLVFTGKCDPFIWPEDDPNEPILIDKEKHDQQEIIASCR